MKPNRLGRKNNMDQKQKQISGPRFNIFDFLILLGAAVCLVAIVTRMIFVNNFKKNVVFADIYFEVENLSDVTANAFCVANESIYLRDSDVKIGLLSTATAAPMTVLTENENGVLVEAVHPDRKTVHGKAQIKGVWQEDGFWIEGTYLATVGKTLNIYTKYASCTITITSIHEK